MAEIDTSALQDVKTGRVSKNKQEWAPFDFAVLHPGFYLACDQSLDATGLVLLLVRSPEDDPEAVEVRVIDAVKVGTEKTEQGGWEDVLRRARVLQELVNGFAARNWPFSKLPIYGVHEAPPIGGGSRFLKPELSLISAYAFREAIRPIHWDREELRMEYRLLPMVRPQDHKALTCGNPNAKKPQHHAVLRQFFMSRIQGSEKVTNEATRDALSIALTAAYRGA